MRTNIKLKLQTILCLNDGFRLAIRPAALVRCAIPHRAIVPEEVIKWHYSSLTPYAGAIHARTSQPIALSKTASRHHSSSFNLTRIVALCANDLHSVVSCSSDLNYFNEECSTSGS